MSGLSTSVDSTTGIMLDPTTIMGHLGDLFIPTRTREASIPIHIRNGTSSIGMGAWNLCHGLVAFVSNFHKTVTMVYDIQVVNVEDENEVVNVEKGKKKVSNVDKVLWRDFRLVFLERTKLLDLLFH
ncbi:hypothetical protein PanWU01x14_122430 [Parasponia andersonii]|uniref:Uncharacterized protein n=1 Tax=Parasponia andersonii TaxID=3476 RepID=A0A2P5CUN6_PARAD|nr:hypothetical protein PanWU01x14_122430 [Parasponia andersonii]